MPTVRQQFTSRKLYIACILLGIATAAMWIGKATFDQWISITEWIFGIYTVGNVSDKAVEKPPIASTTTATTTVVVPPPVPPAL